MRLPPLRLRAPRPSTVFYWVVAILASAPVWIVKYPPLQDVPFHLATMRIIHSYGDPAFGFQHDLTLTLGRTQYLAYYLVGGALAYVIGIVNANIVLMSSYFAGTVLAMRALLRALGRDERLCLLSIPLLSNVLFMYGLFPFLVSIPLMFWGLAIAVRQFEKPTLRRGAGLAAISLLLFYSHIFTFALFGVGCVALFPWTRVHKWWGSIAPFIAPLLVLAWWVRATTAGRLVFEAATHGQNDPHETPVQHVAEFHSWLTDIFADGSGAIVITVFAAVVILLVGLSVGDRPARAAHRAFVLLPLSCLVFYFTMADGHGYIWLISQRFPVLLLLTLIPVLPMPKGGRGAFAAALALGLAAMATINTCKEFIKFQTEEVGDFDAALDVMQPRKRVCALIFDNGTRVGRVQPFLHFGSYYQVYKGGTVMFTYAGYAHWPVDFKPGHYPPPGTPARLRWEWTPGQTPISEIYPYYDYVLVRGGFWRPPPGTYHEQWHGDRWTVWAKDR